jgi:type II secretory pathway pseudopilin PulG
MRLSQSFGAFTILELGVVLAVTAIMAVVVLVSLKNAEEVTDKTSLESSMATFQNILIEGSQRAETAPKDLDLRAVLAIVDPKSTYATYTANSSAYETAISGVGANTQYQWTFNDSSTDPTVTVQTKSLQAADWDGTRSLTFRVNDCGTVCPTNLVGFDNYELKPNINTFCPAEPDPIQRDCNVILKKP